MSGIHHTTCPSCGSGPIQQKLQVKDYTVTGEIFAIWECDSCTLRFTQDAPSQDAIGKYYQSSAYISHTDTREGLINNIYHKVRNYTLGQKKKLLAQTLGKTSAKLLDIGAGTGAFAGYMQSAGWEVTALEPTLKQEKELSRLISWCCFLQKTCSTFRGILFTQSPCGMFLNTCILFMNTWIS